MEESHSKRKWQFACLILVMVLAVSVFFNVNRVVESPEKVVEANPANDLEAIAESANVTWLNFTFTWGPETQKIIAGEFRMKISIMFTVGVEGMKMIVEVNDDDYNAGDYIGLVFDRNKNGHIDAWLEDWVLPLFADNKTMVGGLDEEGFFFFAECPSTPGPQDVTFTTERGYIFVVVFPRIRCSWNGSSVTMDYMFNYIPPLTRGSANPMHFCFVDADVGGVFTESGVFVRFSFYVPEEE